MNTVFINAADGTVQATTCRKSLSIRSGVPWWGVRTALSRPQRMPSLRTPRTVPSLRWSAAAAGLNRVTHPRRRWSPRFVTSFGSARWGYWSLFPACSATPARRGWLRVFFVALQPCTIDREPTCSAHLVGPIRDPEDIAQLSAWVRAGRWNAGLLPVRLCRNAFHRR